MHNLIKNKDIKTEEAKFSKTSNQKSSTKRLARKLANYALEKKAMDVCMMDLRKLTTMTDFFVVCTGATDTQVKAIVDHIEESMKSKNVRVWNKEGYGSLQWVLLDYVDVIVHVFQQETREFYGLESFWGDAKFEHVEDNESTEDQ